MVGLITCGHPSCVVCPAEGNLTNIVGNRNPRNDRILVATPTVLASARGDATNERETIACLERNFATYVIAFRRVFGRSVIRVDCSFAKETKTLYFPFLDVMGLRLIQVFFFALFSSVAVLVLGFSARPRAVIVSHPVVCTVVAAASRLLRIPVMFRVHTVPLMSEEDPLRGTMLGGLIRLFDVVAINTSDLVQVANDASRELLRRVPTAFIPYSVNPAFYQSSVIDDGVFTLGFIGNFSLTRDFKGYLLAINKLKQRIPNIRAQFVGEGPKKKEVVSIVKALGLGDIVQVLPSVPHAEVPRLLSKFDVLVNPQLPENTALSTKVIEAMAAGVPVVTTVPQKGLLQNKGNCLIVRNNPESYEEAISLLYHDINLARKLVENAKRTALSFFAREVVSELYRKTIESLV
jgi:glycosyltransferase involved in cell wall biosynthesis